MNREIADLLMWVWSPYREGAKIKTTKISSKAIASNSAKFCTSKTFPLYGIRNLGAVFVPLFPSST
jgi:hypothetical protein